MCDWLYPTSEEEEIEYQRREEEMLRLMVDYDPEPMHDFFPDVSLNTNRTVDTEFEEALL